MIVLGVILTAISGALSGAWNIPRLDCILTFTIISDASGTP